MTIEHVRIFTPEHVFRMGNIEIEKERIKRVVFDEADDSGACGAAGSLNGCDDLLYAVPGFIDMHLHGCLGKDVCDADFSSLQEIAEYQLRNGVTGFAPATLTLSEENLTDILCVISDYVNRSNKNENYVNHRKEADILGINMEGPFISDEKNGAQDKRYIRKADRQLVQKFMLESGGLLKILGVAPEKNDMSVFAGPEKRAVLPDGSGSEIAVPAGDGMRYLHISLAHTNASYQEAKEAFENGADHVTHLCNAMPVFHHREPGVIGAAFDACMAQGKKDITVELICDGIHVHPAMVRAVFKMFGEKHIIMVSDSMRGTGLPDGVYKLGGLDVEVCGDRAVLCDTADGMPETDRTESGGDIVRPLAGSVTNLFSCFRTAVEQMGLPLAEVLPCVTENPARKLSVFEERGSIEEGKLADILLLDKNLKLKSVMKSGKLL